MVFDARAVTTLIHQVFAAIAALFLGFTKGVGRRIQVFENL